MREGEGEARCKLLSVVMSVRAIQRKSERFGESMSHRMSQKMSESGSEGLVGEWMSGIVEASE